MANTYAQIYIQVIFRDEYLELLQKFNIDFDDKYVFTAIEDE